MTLIWLPWLLLNVIAGNHFEEVLTSLIILVSGGSWEIIRMLEIAFGTR